MKKIILILAVIALGVIACDKNELGDMDHNSINITPVKAKVEMANSDILDIVGNILNLDMSKSPRNLTSKGADRITMHIFLNTDNNVVYTTYVSENNDDFCFSNNITALSSVHLNFVNGNIEVTLGEDAAILSTVKGDFTELFGLSLDVLIKLDSAYDVEAQALFDADNIVTI